MLGNEQLHRKRSAERDIISSKRFFRCGGGEIRTHDFLRNGGLVNRCTRPLCDSSSKSS